MQRLIAAILVGVLGAGYALLYHYIEDSGRGLLVFVSLLAVVKAARAKQEAH